MFRSILLTSLLLPAAVLSITHSVAVGGNSQLIFTPTQIFAVPGDTVNYFFLDLNHTVTAGDPLDGCNPSGKFNSGFVPVAANVAAVAGVASKPSFSVLVKSFAPITVYCAQAQHCQKGMVMVINPTLIVSLCSVLRPMKPDANEEPQGPTTLSAYTSTCAGAAANVPAQNVNGGVLRNAAGNPTTPTAPQHSGLRGLFESFAENFIKPRSAVTTTDLAARELVGGSFAAKAKRLAHWDFTSA
jgi:plastocyanin